MRAVRRAQSGVAVRVNRSTRGPPCCRRRVLRGVLRMRAYIDRDRAGFTRTAQRDNGQPTNPAAALAPPPRAPPRSSHEPLNGTTVNQPTCYRPPAPSPPPRAPPRGPARPLERDAARAPPRAPPRARVVDPLGGEAQRRGAPRGPAHAARGRQRPRQGGALAERADGPRAGASSSSSSSRCGFVVVVVVFLCPVADATKSWRHQWLTPKHGVNTTPCAHESPAVVTPHGVVSLSLRRARAAAGRHALLRARRAPHARLQHVLRARADRRTLGVFDSYSQLFEEATL